MGCNSSQIADVVYQGDKKNGKPHGEGSYIWKTGEEYIVQAQDGITVGPGVAVFSNGCKYYGYIPEEQFKKPNLKTGMNGFGLMTFGEECYKGEFKNGSISGQGTYKFKNGTIYTGNFIGGKANGLGVIEWTNGKKCMAHFTENTLSGPVTFILPDGTKEFDFIRKIIDSYIWINDFHESNKPKECCICYNKITDIIVLQPCGHANTCANCLKNTKKCYNCRAVIQGQQRVFL